MIALSAADDVWGELLAATPQRLCNDIFLLIAAAGLSVIPRYLAVPSIVLDVGVAVALFGWTLIKERRARYVAMALAVLPRGRLGARNAITSFSNRTRSR